MAKVVEIPPGEARRALEDAGAEFDKVDGDEVWRARHGGSVVECYDNGVVVHGNVDKIESLLGDSGSGATATVYFDGASRGNPGPSSAAYVVVDDGVVQREAETIGEATNNEAEYRALIAGLEKALSLGYGEVEAVGDSNLVVRQVSGDWACRSENLKPLYDDVKSIVREFDSFEIRHVPRESNSEADALANSALDGTR